MSIKLFHPATGLRDLTGNTVGDLNSPELASRDDDASPPDAWPVLAGLLGLDVRRSTAEFLRAIHPGDTGFLELRAFQKGKPAAASKFVPLPLCDGGLADIQAYALTHGRHYNLYHAIASRRTNASGKLANCSELWALYIEIDFKRGVPLLDTWMALKSFALTPSFILHSGGGLHVYWCLAQPLDLSTDLGMARAYQWLSDLAHRLGGEPESTEPARVLRIPDTLNLKDEYGPSAPVVTLICADNQAKYTSDDVIAVLGDADLSRKATSVVTSSPPPIDHGHDGKTRIKLARAWLERQAPAVAGQSGDNHTYQICCAIALGHDLDEDDAVEALRDWNARCQPTWSEAELRQKIRNAIRYGKGQRGAKLVEFPTTEAGDAECFAERYSDIVRYDHRQGRWLVANDVGIWEPDPTDSLTRLVVEMMRARQDRANLLSGDAKKKYWNWAVNGESRRRITNTLALAQSVPPLNDRGDGWDPDAMLLGAPNGVIDLTTGMLRPAAPEDRITLRVRVPYDPTAACPLWDKTISEIFAGDGDLVGFVKRALGYSLTGDCREECFFLNWGEGANGKGTIMNTVAWLLGDYADNLSFSALELQNRSAGASPELAKLVGRRFVTASETSEVRLNEARVKALTGRDPLSARFLYHDEFTFQPVAKFWLATNQKPIVRDDSEGFWRRVHLIPFTQSFSGRENKTLKDDLRSEAAGIVAWLVRGAMLWQKDGLKPPKAVSAATTEYRRESEQLTRWIDANCEIRPGGLLQSGPAFDNYKRWCERQHERQDLNQTTFGRKMKERFPPDPTKKRNTVYNGIELRTNTLFSPPPF